MAISNLNGLSIYDKSSADRTPYDGRSFYCITCGCGFGEFMACEEPDCELETTAEAERRQLRLHAALAKQEGGR